MMTPRQRVLRAVQHQQPDRVPLFYRDVPQVDARLRGELGLKTRDELFELLDIMAPGGGFFLGPTHNFQADIPTENILAMYEAARQYPA